MTPNNGSIKAEARREWRRVVREDANINGWPVMPTAMMDEWTRLYQADGKEAAYQDIKQFNPRDAVAIYLGLLVFMEFGIEVYNAGRPIPEEMINGQE